MAGGRRKSVRALGSTSFFTNASYSVELRHQRLVRLFVAGDLILAQKLADPVADVAVVGEVLLDRQAVRRGEPGALKALARLGLGELGDGRPPSSPA